MPPFFLVGAALSTAAARSGDGGAFARQTKATGMRRATDCLIVT
jgi:hypothetical protein